MQTLLLTKLYGMLQGKGINQRRGAMANEQNLRPIELSHEEAVKNGRKGGLKSGESKREAKQMKEIIETLLSMKIKKGTLNDIDKFADLEALKGKNLSVKDTMALNLVLKAVKNADPKTVELVLKLIGEMPKDELDMNLQVPVIFDGEGNLE